MVVKLTGKIAGSEIIFYFAEGNLWQAQIPAIESGEYVTALYATDEAGNESYFATILYVVDTEKLIYRIEITDYSIESAELIRRLAYFDPDEQK